MGKKGTEQSEPPTHMKHYQSEREAIVRQSCLKAAAQVSAPGSTPEHVIKMAEEFEAWVNR